MKDKLCNSYIVKLTVHSNRQTDISFQCQNNEVETQVGNKKHRLVSEMDHINTFEKE